MDQTLWNKLMKSITSVSSYSDYAFLHTQPFPSRGLYKPALYNVDLKSQTTVPESDLFCVNCVRIRMLKSYVYPQEAGPSSIEGPKEDVLSFPRGVVSGPA